MGQGQKSHFRSSFKQKFGSLINFLLFPIAAYEYCLIYIIVDECIHFRDWGGDGGYYYVFIIITSLLNGSKLFYIRSCSPKTIIPLKVDATLMGRAVIGGVSPFIGIVR